MLWLCLDLPFLPLEICTRASAASGPFAVSVGEGRAQQVLIANEVAMRAGVRPGMPLNAAHALVTKLTVMNRDETAERIALERLAAWAGQFTSHVSIVAPRSLLLEIEGSLTLFGGLKRLRHELRTGVTELGYSPVLSVAPTPLAAAWFARAADEEPVTEMPALASRLFDLDLAHADLNDEQRGLLYGLGLQTLGECVRLPRDGLARRLGAEFVVALDRAFGRVPDPRKFYAAPAVFSTQLSIPGSVDSAEGVLFPLNRLLLELTGFLTARVAGVQTLELTLRHPKAMATCIKFGLARATRDARHLMELFRERMGRIELPEPVEEIALHASELLPLTAAEQDFFMPKHARAGAVAEFIERLAARLGRDAVRGLSTVAEHRPERAWNYIEPGTAVMQDAPADRPLWLLKKPVLLDVREGKPCLGHALQLEPDSERIESGWWDEHDVRRDYFVARDLEGVRLWVYRDFSATDYSASGWWLHGVFG